MSELNQITDALDAQTKAITEHKEATETELKELGHRLFVMEQKGSSYHGTGLANKQFTDAGTQFAECQPLQDVLSGKATSGRFLLEKALTANAGDDANNFPGVATQRAGIVDKPTRNLSIVDVFATTNINDGSYSFVQFADYENNAEVVDEGGLKPESTLTFQRQTVEAVVIAHRIPISTQVAADVGGLSAFINAKMTLGVQAKLADAIVNGTDGFTGIATVAREFDAPNGPAADRIAAALAELGTAGYSADTVLMAPADWLALQTLQTGNGEYLLGGPQSVAGKQLWGTRVITDASVQPGKAFVLDSTAITLLVRQSTVLMIGTVDDQFARNMFTVLAEGRFGLAVLNREPILSIDLTEAKD